MKLGLIKLKIIIFCILGANNILAAKPNKEFGLGKEKFEIGKAGLNRITMMPYKIIQAVGDESQYKLKYDKDGGSVYVMPMVHIGKVIELSMRSDIGEIRDLELSVVSGRGKTIKLENIKKLDLIEEQKKEIKEMISSMVRKNKGKYQIRKLDRNIVNNYGFKIKQRVAYQYKDLSGAVLEVSRISNKSSRRLLISSDDIDEKMFSKLFENVIGISIDKAKLQKTISVFVVTENKQK